MEKRVEQMLIPTSYSLSGCLPPTPIPAMALEPIIDSPLSSDESGSDDVPLTKGQKAERLHQNLIFQESQPGCIPDDLGIVQIMQSYKWDNFFCGALSRHFYVSTCTNTVYLGLSAVDAAKTEHRGMDYLPPNSQWLYSISPQGFPMNPWEVKQLYKLCNDHRAHTMD